MKRFPGCDTAYSNLGHIYQAHKKRFDVAMLLYEKALELNPANTWALNNIGTILQDEGRWEEALSYYKQANDSIQALEKDRAYQILHNLGWAYYRCKKYDEACAVLQYILLDKKDDPSVFSDLGCVFYKMGNVEYARSHFEAALKICPHSRYYKRLWRVAYRKKSC